MIAVKEAVELASEFGYEVFEKIGAVEEVEIDGKNWLITLSFEEPVKTTPEEYNPVSTKMPGFLEMSKLLAPPKTEKVYKIFNVNGETKKVTSAKIRQLQ